MTGVQILNLIILALSAIFAVALLLFHFFGFTILDLVKKYKIRNKTLKDYLNEEGGDPGLIKSSMDGLLRYKFVSEIEWQAYDRMEPEKNMLFSSRAGSKLHEKIFSRYYGKAMRNAYKRATKVLFHYDRQRNYYVFDEESDQFADQARKLSKYDCLICKDSGSVWGPARSPAYTTVDCECKEKPVAVKL